MILDRRALNRALLARQLLLDRRELPVLDAVNHLVGLQAQAPIPPYYGLWSRLTGFDPAELSGLLEERRVVRASLLRGTIHLVDARDAGPLRRLLAPLFDRALDTDRSRTPALAGIDRDQLAAAARELLAERPHTSKALGARLAERFPGYEASVLAWAANHLLPVLQVPPRGRWGGSGQATWTTIDAWVGRRQRALPPAKLVRRYLAAFGPATVADLQQWCGLTGLGEVVAGLRLRTCFDEHGRQLYDLPDAPLPDPDTPAPVRFVAPFDNLLLSHADRTRVIADPHRPHVFTINGIIKGTVLVDGFVAGIWRLDQHRSVATLTVEPLVPLSASDKEALEAEGSDLLAFAAATATTRDLRLAAVRS